MQEEAAFLYVTKGWDMIVILQSLSVIERCEIKKELHYIVAARYHFISISLKLSIIVLSATCAILSLVPASNDSLIKFVTGILSVIATALASVVTAVGYDELCEKHKTAYSGFSALQRKIQDEFAEIGDENGEDFVQIIHKELKEISDKSPFIENFIISDIPVKPPTKVDFLKILETVPEVSKRLQTAIRREISAGESPRTELLSEPLLKAAQRCQLPNLARIRFKESDF